MFWKLPQRALKYVNMELEVDEASKSLVASWFSDESIDAEPDDTPSKKKKNKKKAKVEQTESPVVKQKLTNGSQQPSSPSKGAKSAKGISSVASFVEEKLKKKLKKSKHIKDNEKKETEMKFTGMKKSKQSKADSSDDDDDGEEEESKAALVGKKSPAQSPIKKHTVESIQEKLKDDSLSDKAKKRLKHKLNVLLSSPKSGSKSIENQNGKNESETTVVKKNTVKVDKDKIESKLVNGGDVKRRDIKGGNAKGDNIKGGEVNEETDKKKRKKEKKMMEKMKKQQKSDKATEQETTKKSKPKKRPKEESSSDESDDGVPTVAKKTKVKISEDSGTPDRSKHSIITLEQKLSVTSSQVARKNIRKKIAELKEGRQSQSTPTTVARTMMDVSSDSSESEDSDAPQETSTKKLKLKSSEKESLIDKLKKLQSLSLEKSANSSPSTPVSSKKRSAEDASMDNDSPTKLKKKSKVQAEGGDVTQSPEKSFEERYSYFQQRLKEDLSTATRKRIRRQIQKLKLSQSSGAEVSAIVKNTKTKKADKKTKEAKTKKADKKTKEIKTKKADKKPKEIKTKKADSTTLVAKTKKADSAKKKDKKKKEEKESDEEEMLKASEGWETDESSAEESVSEEAPKKQKKAKEGHIKKRMKKRSKQKNIKKDNRPDHLKPPHLRLAAKKASDDSS